MALPPKKDPKPSSSRPTQGGPPQGGSPQGMPPGSPPQGMDQGPMIPNPGMPKPGGTMDPMMAMLNGMPPLGMPPAPPPPGPVMGGNGLPVGGSQPDMDPNFSPDMDGSALLQGLAASIGDPYSAGPEGHADLEGMGTGDPQMGLEQLIQLMAMAQAGTGGMQGMGMGMGMGVPPGGSGVNYDRGNPGIMF